MSRQRPSVGLGGTIALVGGAHVSAALLAQPWMDRWGSTEDERARPLPGDDFVLDAEQHTHAVTIDAPAQNLWPWLVQMGQGRGGF